MMNDRAHARHLSACETMDSSSCICTYKTGTLTTNHIVVNKLWICEEVTLIEGNESADELKTKISEDVLNTLSQAIFQNTSCEVVKDKDGKNPILGTPTKSTLLEFGLLLGADFDTHRRAYKILKVEPFNSIRKKMSVLVGLPDGGVQAFCKGASMEYCFATRE